MKLESFKVPKIAWFTITWLFLAIIGIWLNYNVGFSVDSGLVITVASISIMINIVVLAAVFATGIGQKIFKRFKNRLLYHTGRYVNAIYISKNGPAKEIFKAVDQDTKTYNVLGQKFIRNPKLLFPFEKIPTYLIREGNPDPVDIWATDLTSEMSNAEMDIAMTSAQNFDLKQWINQHKIIILIAFAVIIGLGAASVFSGFSVYQMLRDGGYKAVECVLPPSFVAPGV